MNQEELFHYYILDPERIKRERTYFLRYAFIGALYILSIFLLYANFPTGTWFGIPIFCFFAWVFIGAHYLIFTVYLGAKMYDLKGERAKGLE